MRDMYGTLSLRAVNNCFSHALAIAAEGNKLTITAACWEMWEFCSLVYPRYHS